MANEIAICPACGGRFNPVCGNHRRTYCSIGCQNRVRCYKYHHGTLDGFKVKIISGSAAWKELNDPRRGLAERQARRDAEYAANAAPKVTVEERALRDSELGMVMRRIETRGNRFCGSLAGVHRQLVTDYGVV